MQCLSCFCCVSLDLVPSFSCISEETISSDAASVQGRILLYYFFNSCGFYSRKHGMFNLLMRSRSGKYRCRINEPTSSQ